MKNNPAYAFPNPSAYIRAVKLFKERPDIPGISKVVDDTLTKLNLSPEEKRVTMNYFQRIRANTPRPGTLEYDLINRQRRILRRLPERTQKQDFPFNRRKNIQSVADVSYTTTYYIPGKHQDLKNLIATSGDFEPIKKCRLEVQYRRLMYVVKNKRPTAYIGTSPVVFSTPVTPSSIEITRDWDEFHIWIHQAREIGVPRTDFLHLKTPIEFFKEKRNEQYLPFITLRTLQTDIHPEHSISILATINKKDIPKTHNGPQPKTIIRYLAHDTERGIRVVATSEKKVLQLLDRARLNAITKLLEPKTNS